MFYQRQMKHMAHILISGKSLIADFVTDTTVHITQISTYNLHACCMYTLKNTVRKSEIHRLFQARNIPFINSM